MRKVIFATLLLTASMFGQVNMGPIKATSVDTSGANPWTFQHTFNAGSQFKVRPWYDVTAYGADSTGVSDSTSAINSAIAAAVAANGGTVHFPAGKYLTTGITVTDCNGLIFAGDGAYPSTTVRGSQLVMTASTGDLFKIAPSSAACGFFTIRDLYFSGNSAGTTGNGLVIDASAQSISNFEIRNIAEKGAKQAGVVFKAGTAGSGGFMFHGKFTNSYVSTNGADGVDIIGRVSELTLDTPYSDQNTSGKAFSVDGGTLAEAGSITFIHPIAGAAQTSFYFQDVQGLNLIDPYSESATVNIFSWKFCRRCTFRGGSGVIRQTGTADGAIIDVGASASVYNDNGIIDLPGWVNSSSKTRIKYVNSTVQNFLLGNHADGAFSAADITGSTFYANGRGFIFTNCTFAGCTDTGLRTMLGGAQIGTNGTAVTQFQMKNGVTGCATAASAGAACTTVVTWPAAFADNGYIVSCLGSGLTSGIPMNGGLTARSTTTVTFQTVAGTAAAAQYTTIECAAWHP